MKLILSYPRSGSHLCRFFIELLSEKPTISKFSKRDSSLYLNDYSMNIPFNISSDNIKKNDNLDDCFKFYHSLNKSMSDYNQKNNTLIIIIRNPNEVLLRHTRNKIQYDRWDGFNEYFNIITQYKNFKGKKLLLYYEDILNNKVHFIIQLYNFIEVKNRDKLKYVLKNLDELWNASLNGKKRYWGGNKSNNEINYYYKSIDSSIKEEFDNYIKKKLHEFPYIKKKYNL